MGLQVTLGKYQFGTGPEGALSSAYVSFSILQSSLQQTMRRLLLINPVEDLYYSKIKCSTANIVQCEGAESLTAVATVTIGGGA